jgi:glycosyltransferase involved in cell wall biosynthesis
MKKNPKITYLVMVYNEIRTIKKAIQDVIDINYRNKEILVIDNGSTDGSRDVINSFKNIKKILRKKNLGAGKTIEEGIKKAKGSYIFIQFSDLEFDHLQSLDMLNYAKKNNLDIVLGSRLMNKNIWRELNKKKSYLATIVTTFIINKFYNKRFTDIIGSKLYRTSEVRKIPITSYGAGFDWEFISRACKRNLKIGEISVKYKPRLNQHEKKIRFYNIFNAIYELFKVKLFE